MHPCLLVSQNGGNKDTNQFRGYVNHVAVDTSFWNDLRMNSLVDPHFQSLVNRWLKQLCLSLCAQEKYPSLSRSRFCVRRFLYLLDIRNCKNAWNKKCMECRFHIYFRLGGVDVPIEWHNAVSPGRGNWHVPRYWAVFSRPLSLLRLNMVLISGHISSLSSCFKASTDFLPRIWHIRGCYVWPHILWKYISVLKVHRW